MLEERAMALDVLYAAGNAVHAVTLHAEPQGMTLHPAGTAR
jgi:hypothetical protein